DLSRRGEGGGLGARLGGGRRLVLGRLRGEQQGSGERQRRQDKENDRRSTAHEYLLGRKGRWILQAATESGKRPGTCRRRSSPDAGFVSRIRLRRRPPTFRPPGANILGRRSCAHPVRFRGAGVRRRGRLGRGFHEVTPETVVRVRVGGFARELPAGAVAGEALL